VFFSQYLCWFYFFKFQRSCKAAIFSINYSYGRQNDRHIMLYTGACCVNCVSWSVCSSPTSCSSSNSRRRLRVRQQCPMFRPTTLQHRISTSTLAEQVMGHDPEKHWGRWKCGSGKCRSGKYRSDNLWKAVKQKIKIINIFN